MKIKVLKKLIRIKIFSNNNPKKKNEKKIFIFAWVFFIRKNYSNWFNFMNFETLKIIYFTWFKK
jgi:hypothetical protein